MAENLNKILDIQKKIAKDDLVQPHRTFIKEGSIWKHKPKERATFRAFSSQETIIQSYLFLFNDLLVICQKSKIPNPIEWEYKFHDLIKLEDLTVNINFF